MSKSQQSINCRGQILHLDKPLVMGIINITSDSFYAGSRVQSIDALLAYTQKMIHEGVDILDLGAMSSKPGSEISHAETEKNTLVPAVEAILKEYPDIILSIDTVHSEVAKKCLDVGAHIINDISGGTYDASMMSTVATYDTPYIIMHMQGLPKTMQDQPQYNNVVMEVLAFLKDRVREAQNHGIKDIIIDPGFGFGKTLKHNFEVLNHFEIFKILDLPLLAGLSRKSMIWKTLDTSPDEAINGTTALNMVALMKGSDILRVHDVKQARETVQLFEQLKS